MSHSAEINSWIQQCHLKGQNHYFLWPFKQGKHTNSIASPATRRKLYIPFSIQDIALLPYSYEIQHRF